MLSVQSLLGDLGLELAAGEAGAGTPIRWVHVSELADPTPWMSGGELLLTTGMALTGDAALREYVRRLSDHQLAGLGFGTGFDYDALPAALVSEATARGLPLFEVPYDLPFIAITESAFDRLVNEQYDILRRGMAVRAQLERLVIDERGLDELVRTLANAIGGSVLVIDGRGSVIASQAFRVQPSAAAVERLADEIARHSAHESAGAFIPEEVEFAGRAVALPVPVRAGATGRPWLVAMRDGGPADYERLVIRQAATVVAFELMRKQTIRETERRLAGDVIGGALTGQLIGEQISERLRPFGIGERIAVIAADCADPRAGARGCAERSWFGRDRRGGAGRSRRAAVRGLRPVRPGARRGGPARARRDPGGSARTRGGERRGPGSGAASPLERGPLRPRGGRHRQRSRPGRRHRGRPGHLRPAAVAAGSGRAAALLRRRARADRAAPRRPRAAALARGVH
jgi:purine catabolism regulator